LKTRIAADCGDRSLHDDSVSTIPDGLISVGALARSPCKRIESTDEKTRHLDCGDAVPGSMPG